AFKPKANGVVGILAAGTSDIPIAEEARVILEELGCRVLFEYDVGIAGIHRLFPALGRLKRASVLIAVAGMEGALPSVVSGLVRVPVIGVPTSVGYGINSKGMAALQTMLNSCSPVAVMNIDNGYGAAALAYKIAARLK
ncbi:MAG: nickel pincer cofactor biosynthesis protein LarB, partial [Candidatus Altiarchaeota archaeon]|nr:nickel pincer cofactor biosynthesis protein LarB [Candidatus Altiarchaeota archaeon]